MEFIQNFDDSIILLINEIRGGFFADSIMKFISFLGNGGWFYILIGLIMVLFIKKNNNIGKWGIVLLLSLAISAIIVNIGIKPYVARLRPFDRLMLDIIINKPLDYSFPSGHTTAAFVAAVVFLYMNRKIGLFMIVFAILMGISRMYLLVHFPSDVICGAIIGSVTSIIVCEIFKRKYNINKIVKTS